MSKYLIRMYERDFSKGRMAEIAMVFSMMLTDLSFMRGTPNEHEIQFDRKELASLFGEEFREKYGHAVYGFKGDRTAELIAPLMKRHWVRSDGNDSYDDYALSQVVCMDVIYGKAKAKSELGFLCSIVDRFKMSADEKQTFLEEMLQYWMLSVKDPKWKEENERRYVLFDHFGDEYLDVEVDETFFKLKTDLLKNPDFVVPPHPLKTKLDKHIGDKIANGLDPCFYCEDCLNRDYDVSISKQCRKCPICGSHRLRRVGGDENIRGGC